jgi:hypothetical protein
MSAEFSPHAVQAMVDLFGAKSVVELQEERLPFDEDTFDTIVIIDGLEQIRKDAEFLKDCHRCLKPGGELIVHVHHLKSFSIIRGVRKLLGLTDEKRGFVRPGYRMRDLYEISKDGFDMVESAMYGGFGVQFFDAWIQSLAGPGTSYSGDPAAEQGQILSQQDLRKFSKQYRVSCILYPVMKFAAGLDAVFAFTCNHDLVVQARPRPWQQRKSVRMRDGRSIADATINTRIGSAADLTDPKNNRSSAG